MARSMVWERVAHHAHLYALPTAGAASVTIGSLALLGPAWEPAALLPAALVAVGATALTGAIGSYMCMPTRAERESPSPNARPTGGPVVEPAFGGAAARSPRVEDSRFAEARPSSGIGRATLAHLTEVEDELWRRWASPQNIPLGASLVGPVPETAYSPHKAGAFVAFPERDADIVRRPADARSRAEPRSSARPAPPPAPPSRSPAPILPRERAPSSSPVGLGSPIATGRAGSVFSLDALDHPAYLESVNPILPRLRPSAAPPAEARRTFATPVATRTAPVRGRFCSECSNRLLDFRSWVECRICRQPLCDQCLQESFRQDDIGACASCRTARRWPSNRGRPSGAGRPAVSRSAMT